MFGKKDESDPLEAAMRLALLEAVTHAETCPLMHRKPAERFRVAAGEYNPITRRFSPLTGPGLAASRFGKYSGGGSVVGTGLSFRLDDIIAEGVEVASSVFQAWIEGRLAAMDDENAPESRSWEAPHTHFTFRPDGVVPVGHRNGD